MELAADVTPGGRTAVIRVVGRQGPLTAAAAAALLGVTPAAVRRHLDALVDGRLVAPYEAAARGVRGRGRPARAFVLTSAGRAAFHADDSSAAGGPEELAAAALDFIAEAHGEQAVARFAHQRAKDMESRFAARLAAVGPDLEQRVAALAQALDEEGYAATARPVVSGLQLCQGGCPVHRIAAAHPQLCEAETEAFARLLGSPVQRLATLAGGAHVCTTHVARPRPVPGSARRETRTVGPAAEQPARLGRPSVERTPLDRTPFDRTPVGITRVTGSTRVLEETR